ncbi:MAG: tetratricopeptide repeat protein [Acidobacteriaceae bacterium]
MRLIGRLGLVGAGLGLMLAVQVARAQGGCTFTDDNGKSVFWPNCQDPSAKKGPDGTTPNAPTAKGAAQAPTGSKNPAQSFPFPSETPAAPIVRPGAAAGQAGGASTPAASRFPFPGADSSGKTGSSSSGPMKDAGSSGASSGSSSSSSSEGGDPSAGPLGDGDTDPAAEAAAARRAERLRKARDGSDFHQTPDQRETEDLKVAAFYQNDGNYRGAYERATDAVSIAGDDAAAHLALAEAARKIGKLDEAESHYKKCLQLDPVPKVRKAAEQALKQMTAGS